MKDYQEKNQKLKKQTTGKYTSEGNINPKEFVLNDSKVQSVDKDFIEQEKPLYSDVSEQPQEKSVEIVSLTDPEEEDESQEPSGYNMSQATEAINPQEFKIGDDLSKFDENDFSQNSKSNCAKGINKDRKRQKKVEKNFEKSHGTKLNQDLETHSEQSVRLGEKEKKRPKTAYKEKHKPDEPGVSEIVMHKKPKLPVTEEREVELARRKFFKKLKDDRDKKKQIINKAVKMHVDKPPRKVNRPKTSKPVDYAPKEVDLGKVGNEENDYEAFVNGRYWWFRVSYGC